MEQASKQEQELAARQVAMYGVTEADLRAFVAKYVGAGKLFESRELAAISILSDAQEEMEQGLQERATASINRAKWLVDPYNHGREV